MQPSTQPNEHPLGRDAATMVRPLDDPSGCDVAFAGGQGARLASGAEPGSGFVIGTPAYALLCDSGMLRRRLAEALRDVTSVDRGRLMGAALMARSLVGAEPLPGELADDLEQAYRSLVRDDRDASVLVSLSEPSPVGVAAPTIEAHGTGSFFRAVRHCWSAFYDPRRVLARAERGLPQVDADVALVVRRLPRL